MGEMDAYKDVFLQESAEFIQGMVDGLLQLESNPEDLEPVEVVFRGAHSLKGMAATMGYDATAEFTHKMESLMATVRKREQPVDATLVDLMLGAIDQLRVLIEAESSESEPPDVSLMVSAIVERTERRAAAAPAAAAAPTPVVAEPEQVAVPSDSSDGTTYCVRVTLDDECVLKSVRAYMVIKRLAHLGTVIETKPSAREIEDEAFDLMFEVVVKSALSPAEVQDAACHVSEVASVVVEQVAASAVPEPDAKPKPRARTEIPKLSETQTVRISIGHLDHMVNLVGELVILRSRLEGLAQQAGDQRTLDALEDLRQVSGELQHEVMQTRMVPVGNVFNRFPRMVRDLARDLGKDIAFEMDGLDIELDRTVLDEISDPIVHLLRNAVDHGIEAADVRAAADKPTTGIVRLSATRERDQVQIIVSDDGKGLDTDIIWRKACERGIAEAAQRDAFSVDDVLMLTCTPGFSTTDEATKVSGRGVGMDVVRGKIEYLGGSLGIKTGKGTGSVFSLSLPLTLAIIQALMMESAGQVFAIPLGTVVEVLQGDDAPIDTVDGRPVVVLRDGDVVPVYRLEVLLGSAAADALMPTPEEHVLLLETAGTVRALAVRTLMGRQEVVVKPLARMFKQIRGLGGATVLGDGRVALILDPRSLFTMGE